MLFSETTSRCLRFWYSINGNNIGAIRVEIIYDSSNKDVIWQLSKDKGDQWQEATVGFNSKNTTYRFLCLFFN